MNALTRGWQYLAASVSQGIFGIISLLVILPALSNADLGYIAALETLAYLFSTLIGFNLDRAASRFYFLENDNSYRQKLYATLNCFVLFTLVVGASIAFAFQSFVLKIFPELPFMPLIALTLLKTSIDIYLKIEYAFLVAGRQSAIYAKSTIFSGISSLALSLLFVLICQLGVLGFVLAQTIASFVKLTYLVFVSISKQTLRKLDKNILLNSIEYAWPFFPTLVVAWVLSYYDRILISKFLGIESLGTYALSLKLAGTLLLVTGSIVSAIYPTFYAVYSKVESEKNIGIGIDFSRALITIFAFISLALLTIGSIIFELIIGPRGDASFIFFGFLVVNYWVGVVGFIATESLMRAKATTTNMVLSLFLGLVAVGLNYLLIPSLGISGAIVSGFITYILGFLLQLQAARRLVLVPFCWRTYIGSLCVLIIGALLLKLQAGWQLKMGLFALGVLFMWNSLHKGVSFFKKFG